jgi:hypothetical protein
MRKSMALVYLLCSRNNIDVYSFRNAGINLLASIHANACIISLMYSKQRVCLTARAKHSKLLHNYRKPGQKI